MHVTESVEDRQSNAIISLYPTCGFPPELTWFFPFCLQPRMTFRGSTWPVRLWRQSASSGISSVSTTDVATSRDTGEDGLRCSPPEVVNHMAKIYVFHMFHHIVIIGTCILIYTLSSMQSRFFITYNTSYKMRYKIE